jgi:hypothetical protein
VGGRWSSADVGAVPAAVTWNPSTLGCQRCGTKRPNDATWEETLPFFLFLFHLFKALYSGRAICCK